MSSFYRFALAFFTAVAVSHQAGVAQQTAPVQGEWTLNREMTPPAPRSDDAMRRPESRRPPGGGGGFPGRAGVFGGEMPGGRRGPSDKDIRKFEAVRRRIHEIPQRLVISIDGTRVQLVDEIGRATNLVADGKKQDRLTGDGEFTSITRFDGGKLVVEEDFDGPKVTTTYQRLAGDGEGRLQVTLQIDGMPEGRGRRGDQNARVPIMRVYDAGKQAP